MAGQELEVKADFGNVFYKDKNGSHELYAIGVFENEPTILTDQQLLSLTLALVEKCFEHLNMRMPADIFWDDALQIIDGMFNGADRDMASADFFLIANRNRNNEGTPRKADSDSA